VGSYDHKAGGLAGGFNKLTAFDGFHNAEVEGRKLGDFGEWGTDA
jgi:hypothetical protein